MFNSPSKGLPHNGRADQDEDIARHLMPITVSGLVESVREGRRNHMFTSPPPSHPGFKKDFFNPTPRNRVPLAQRMSAQAYEQNFEQDHQEEVIAEDNPQRTALSKTGPNSIAQLLDFTAYEDVGPKTPLKTKTEDLDGKLSTASNSNRKAAKGLQLSQNQRCIVPMIHESLSSKGLKNLAESVRRAVMQLGQATYKEVAHTLIKALQRQNLITDSFRDEQNIKRRVYDALNVFVSANVLTKQGKYVSMRPTKQPKTVDHKKQIEELRQALMLTELNLNEKYKRLVALRNKYLANEYLIARNKVSKVESSSRIQFPFIAIISRFPPEKSISLVDKQHIKLIFRPPGFRIAGDIDTILELGFHETNHETNLNRNILTFNVVDNAEEAKSPTSLPKGSKHP